MIKKLMLLAVSGLLILFTAGCRESADLKNELAGVRLSLELPAVQRTECKYLMQADDEVYEQQIAACEMYDEAYTLTDSAAYREKYGRKIKTNKLRNICYERRQQLNLDIATALNDNVRAMIYSVEDCDNIGAYLKRVNYDAENFFDYYVKYKNAGRDIKPACRILTSFYERSNILAFRFMKENKDDIIDCAVQQIIKNSRETEDLTMYIADNNELIKALNAVYGGVPSEYVEIINVSEFDLVRRMLEENIRLSEEDIDKLMIQLGEATPEPEPTATPEPTEEPTETPEPKATDRPDLKPDEIIPLITQVPTATRAPAVTQMPTTPAPVTSAPQLPVRTQAPQITQAPVMSTPEVYMFGDW